MGLKLYGAVISPCVRSVLLTIEALELKNVEIIEVDLLKGETQRPEFAAINPLQKVPLLKDGDLTLWDSHSINAYLVSKYGKSDALYPKKPEARALIDSMNQFDTGVLFAAHDALIKSIVTCTRPTTIDPELAKNVEDAYGILDTILANRPYVAGSDLSIADFSIATTISSSENMVPVKQEKVLAWQAKIKSLPYWTKVNSAGIDQVKGVLNKKLIHL